MPFNTVTGVYTPPNGATNAASGQVIQSAIWNTIHNDLSTALTLLGSLVLPAPSSGSAWYSLYANLSDVLNLIVPNNSLASWIPYTPIVTAAGGTITTVGTVAGRYYQLGNAVFLQAFASITTNGSGSLAIVMSLPTVAPLLNAFANAVAIVGREDTVTGSILVASAQGNGSIGIRTGANAYPGQNGALIRIGGTYETFS